jgi:hypothetical protein
MSTVPLIAPDTNLATAYPEVVTLRAALHARDWPAIQELFASVDWDGASLFTWAAGVTPPAYGFLSSTVESEEVPDPLAATLLASHLIQTGWEIRTAARAAYVSQQQAAVFFDYLRRAEKLLAGVTDRDPDQIIAWELRLITARGLNLGLDESWQRYQQVANRVPHHLPAQRQMLQELCPKWRGTLQQMHTFARDCAAAAPEGAPNAVLIADAHVEHWLALEGASSYMRTPEVWREIREAAARSIWHADYRRRYGWVWEHNAFAMAFSLAGDRAAAAACFAVTGHLADEDAWAYLGDPAQQFHKHRKKARADAPPPQLREMPAAAAAARPPGAGGLVALVGVWTVAVFLVLCGLLGAVGGAAEPEDFGGGEWAVVGVALAMGIGLVPLAVWMMRRRRRARQQALGQGGGA